MPKRILFVALLLIAVLIKSDINQVFAQADQSLAVAQSYVIGDEVVEDGDIISATNSGYYLSKVDYDTAMVGIVSKNPAISLTFTDLPNSYPVISTGNGYINVSTINGPIKKGDLITSSKMPGVGMKAVQSGYVIASALEDYTEADTSKKGKILASLNLRFAISPKGNDLVVKSLSNMLSLSTIAALEQPSEIFKYVLAGFIVLISVLIGIITFGRNAALGIEALGRNPRAGQSITLGVIINVMTAVSIIAAGLGAAYFILVL